MMRAVRTLTLTALALTVAAFGADTTAPRQLTLVRNGAPTAAIALERTPTKAAQFAAYELQWHVKAISGATLPILRGDATAPEGYVKVYVGDGPRARALSLGQNALEMQEYVVQCGPNDIVLVGKDADDRAEVKCKFEDLGNWQANANWPGFWEERGTLHAVYDFLRDACGARWYNPTDTGTVILRRSTLTVKAMSLRRAPSFRYRDSIGNANTVASRTPAISTASPASSRTRSTSR